MRTIDTSTPVVVLGFHHGSLGIARSLGRLGVEVHGIDANTTAPGLKSRYVKAAVKWNVRDAGAARSVEFLLDYAKKLGRKPLLIPTSDDGAIFLAQNADRLMEGYIFHRVPEHIVRGLSDKKMLYALACSVGVPMPVTSFPTSVQDVERYASSVKFPVMLKGIDGLKLERRTGKKMVIARSAEELLAYFRELDDPAEPNLMIQEYIPGGDDTIWMFNGFFDKDSKCRAAFTGKKLRQHPIHVGATSLGICLENPAVVELTTRFMERIGYRGILDIGWRYDARDGSYKLLDPNPRIGSTFRLFVGEEGVDVVRCLYLDITGQQLPAAIQREGRKWVVEDQDWDSARDYVREGSMSWVEWFRSFRGVEEGAWFARDDLKPFVAVVASRVSRGLLRLLKPSPRARESRTKNSPAHAPSVPETSTVSEPVSPYAASA